MSKVVTLTCIVCPVGCDLEIVIDGDEVKVSGNRCPRGQDYAIKEVRSPERILTTTCKIRSSVERRLPVKTEKPIPKEKLFDVMNQINKIVVSPPIKRGEPVIKNVLGLGVDVVATKSVLK